MWKTLYQSVAGTSHERSAQPCQDSCAATEVSFSDGTALILACSDGAGSAELSCAGSRRSCDVLVEAVAADLRSADRLATVSVDKALLWVDQVHHALLAEAAAREVDARQLACTLLFAVLGPSGAAFAQIGDGAIVVLNQGEYRSVFWPQSGEYANTTNFITDPRFASLLEFSWHDEPVDEVALFTDGLQMLGLDFKEKQAHGPFFAPMFRALRERSAAGELMGPLRDFLQSPELVARTDDDKTLILATRVSS